MNNHPSSTPLTSPSARARRLQRSALIGLGIGSGIVLLIGVAATVLTRNPGAAPVPATFSTVASTT